MLQCGATERPCAEIGQCWSTVPKSACELALSNAADRIRSASPRIPLPPDTRPPDLHALTGLTAAIEKPSSQRLMARI
jgi:hypothetical protein